MGKTVVEFARPYDFRRSLGILARGGQGNLCCRLSDSAMARAMRTPEGPATVVATRADAHHVTMEAEGTGKDWALAHASEFLGALDDNSNFVAHHGLVRNLHAQFSGMHIVRTGLVFEALVGAIIEQKVVAEDAHQSYRRLVKRFGEPAPGGHDLFLPPSAKTLGEMSYSEYHACGLERRRAETIRFAARRVRRIDQTTAMTPDAAYARLQALPGVGPWTAAVVGGVALGDPDCVAVGDFHLPNTVSWALAGESRGTDERMLELLEPYAGHRGRVIRYLVMGGVGAPRRGPRTARRDLSRE